MAAEWWRGAVIYQIYPRSFFDSNGDGIGDLPGVTAKLDHVASLGVDAIWISPFFKSPMADFGYDVSDYCSVDPIFGTLDDFDRVVARAHDLGLKVLIDQVWSHTSDRHPWFLESCIAPDGPKGDWFVWAEPKPDGSPPNNWQSVFGGPAWRWEPRRRRFYLHHFLSSQPALNLRNPAVLDALLQTGRFWLDRGVDGFRLDAVDFMLHDEELRDNPPRPMPAGGDYPVKLFGMQDHLYDCALPETVDLAARIRRLMEDYPARATIAELSSQPGALARAARYTGADNSRFHMAYTLGIMRKSFTAQDMAESIAEAEIHFGDDGWLSWSFSNHDVERVASRWGDGSPEFCRLAMALLLSLRGSICVYQGEELGLTEADVPFERMRDPFGINFYPQFLGRDGSRTPLPWQDGADHAGFSTAEPWLPVPEDHHGLAVSRQDQDQRSVLNAWRGFLRWRKQQPALLHGTVEQVKASGPVLSFLRRVGDQHLFCVFNLSDRAARSALPAGATPLAGHGFAASWGEAEVELPPYGAAFATYSVSSAGVERSLSAGT